MTKFPVLPSSDTPWTQLLQHIPFADNVCVAGSVGTWFAQLALTGSPPIWSPGDIDVFVLTQSDSDFAQMVRSVAQVVYSESGKRHIQLLRVEAALVGNRKHVIDLYVDGIANLSFVQVTFDDPIDDWVECLVSSFDISVCKVSLHRSTEEVEVFLTEVETDVDDVKFKYFILMNDDIRLDISIGQMEVAFVPSSRFWTNYAPGMRSLRRLEKYESRGFRLSKITFESSNMSVLQFASIFEAHENQRIRKQPRINN
jgi:hypothetical protein